MRLTLRLARILAQRGVPESAIGKMVTTRPSDITYLNAADLLALLASMGNPFANSSLAMPRGALKKRQELCLG
jgi:hypothetical protein